MCGRFTLAVTPDQLRESFPWLESYEPPMPRYNVAPSQPLAVVPNDGKRRLDYFVWGLVPSWAKDPKIGNRMINARGETVAEKPSFRAAFRRRRCLVLADGFYEWKTNPGSKRKTPYYIHLKSKKPFAFAGIWENWFAKDGSQLTTCAIITTSPNEMMESIHNRMPVILPEDIYDKWLTPGETQPADLLPMLQPYPTEKMDAFPVSTLVNNPSNDTPECILPA